MLVKKNWKQITTSGLVVLGLAWFFLHILSWSPQRTRQCLDDPKQQKAASKLLTDCYHADIQDRTHWDTLNAQQLYALKERDRERRQYVAEIFANGCLRSAKDYARAALIYQHGTVSDHYYQTFIWSKRAVELGESSQKNMMALSIDRYLVSIGKKQLFGSQSFASDATQGCFCMEPIETSFPDQLRQAYLGKTLADQYAQIAMINQTRAHCITENCKHTLESSPQGTVPGFW